MIDMNIVRSNQNAVMFRIGTTNAIYSIFDNRSQTTVYTSTSSDNARAYWNRHYRNSRQFVMSANGTTHSSLCQ